MITMAYKFNRCCRYMFPSSPAAPAAGSPGSERVLLRGAEAIVTGAPGPGARHPGPDVRIHGSRIEAIGRLESEPGEKVIDCGGCVIYPAWVNTHHHLQQSIAKGVPAGMNVPLAQWSERVAYAYRRKLDEDTLRVAATIGIAELMLSGTATVADHHFAYYPGIPYDSAAVLFDVAQRLGVRYVHCRGATTIPRDYQKTIEAFARPETLDDILSHIEQLVSRFHDSGPESMRRIVVAPTTTVWSARPGELREYARAARRLGLRLHTHLSETRDYEATSRERFGLSAIEHAASEEWLGEDVWFAHLVHVNDAEIDLLGRTRTGVSHCPQSNCRLGSGIAPVPKMVEAGMRISLGVDGAAANEAADMVSESHVAWLLHRAVVGPHAVSPEDVVSWGTRGGALVLGLERVGLLQPGFAADIAVYELNEPRYFGLHDLAVGPVVCGGHASLKRLFCAGRAIVEDGRIPGLDLSELGAQARRAVGRIAP